MASSDEFDVDKFETRLENLKDTQEGIQSMSKWCLHNRSHHKKIVNSWLNVLKRVRVDHRLTLFHLANDVIQYSKRKKYEFVESWGTALQRATTMVRDDKVRGKIFRIFKIWQQREVYSEEYISDLNGLLSMNPPKKSQSSADTGIDDYQNGVLIANIRECVQFASATDRSFKNLPRAPICDIESVKNSLKDKSHTADVEREFDSYVVALEAYVKSLLVETKSRKELIANIEKSEKFYLSQRGEVKVVVNAYKNFGSRIKGVKKKLDEMMPTLQSPIPSPDINAPSPEPDADINLPDDFSSMFKNGFSSYMDGKLPFDINDFRTDESQPIQVINNRDEHFNPAVEYYKPTDSLTAYSANGMPLPVPPVHSEYSSLAQTSSTAMYAPSGYRNHGPTPYNQNASYTSDSSYVSNSSNVSYDASMPLMPPPMPPSLGANQSEDFNSTWDMDMTWTSMTSDSSFEQQHIETPLSPPDFEREVRGGGTSVIEYVDENNGDLRGMSAQDVDHRQLHLSANQLLKKRVIDIDHRNLISLTGSPSQKPIDEHSKAKAQSHNPHQYVWTKDRDLRSTNNLQPPNSKKSRDEHEVITGDVDYRTLGPPPARSNNDKSHVPPPPLPPMPLQSFSRISELLALSQQSDGDSKKGFTTTSEEKNKNNKFKVPRPSPAKSSGSSNSKEDGGYDPNDLVESIDMDMSDEDIDSLFREIEQETEEIHQHQSREEQQTNDDNSREDGNDKHLDDENRTGNYNPEDLSLSDSESSMHSNNNRPALLDTPDYPPSANVWDINKTHPRFAIDANSGPWTSPRVPFRGQNPNQVPIFGPRHPQQFQFPRNPFAGNPHRAFSPQGFRGGVGGRPPRPGPYFNNRGRGGAAPAGPRGNFRGKFRGNAPWI